MLYLLVYVKLTTSVVNDLRIIGIRSIEEDRNPFYRNYLTWHAWVGIATIEQPVLDIPYFEFVAY